MDPPGPGRVPAAAGGSRSAAGKKRKGAAAGGSRSAAGKKQRGSDSRAHEKVLATTVETAGKLG